MGEDGVVLRHPLSSRIMHFVNMVCWYVLFTTGALVYFKLVGGSEAALLMKIHILFGLILTVVVLSYVVMAPDRVFLFLQEILNWDRDTIAWWKNFGGYPYRFLGKTRFYRYIEKFWFAKPGCPPQSKYNAGQKFLGILVVFSLAVLGASGWLLFLFRQALGKDGVWLFFNAHVWIAIVVTVFVTFVHIPLVIINWPDFVSMFRIGSGTVPVSWAREHNPKWFEREVVELAESMKSGKP